MFVGEDLTASNASAVLIERKKSSEYLICLWLKLASVVVLQFRVVVDVASNVTLCSASSVPITTEPYGGLLGILLHY